MKPAARSSVRVATLSALLCLLLAAVPVSAAADDPLAQQRDSYAKAMKAQKSGRHTLAAGLIRGLEDYPLYPYYLYNDLRRRLHEYPTDDLARFFTAYDNSYLAGRLRTDWLKQLARGRRWADFLDFYRPADDIEMRCLQLKARISEGLDDGVLEDTRAIWLSGESLPDACDPAFDRLYASAMMTDALVWQRIRLAMAKRKTGLARYLSRRLRDPRYADLHQLWQTAHANPARMLARSGLGDDAETRHIALYAVERLLQRRLETAEHAWDTIAARLPFTSEESGRIAAAIAVRAASDRHARHLELLDRVPAAYVTADVRRYRLRRAIEAQDWSRLLRWTGGEPGDGVAELRWRYWHARASAAVNGEDGARPLFETLAGERDYYGFLAADRLNREYAMNLSPVASDSGELAAIQALPGIGRAAELYRSDNRFQARRELYFELARMDRRQQEITAEVVAGWGWDAGAIAALGRAQSWDDLELRFPLRHVDAVSRHGPRRSVAPARLLAIMRSESAFVSDARSGAGALGLMQLLPATARETARRIGWRYTSARDLYVPDTNIALGAAYLAQVLKRFDGHFAMAAAAYNAGPHRVHRWRPQRCTDADVWIDAIPFTETRRYVRRALFYTAIYEWRLGQAVGRLSDAMPPITPAGASREPDCKS